MKPWKAVLLLMVTLFVAACGGDDCTVDARELVKMRDQAIAERDAARVALGEQKKTFEAKLSELGQAETEIDELRKQRDELLDEVLEVRKNLECAKADVATKDATNAILAAEVAMFRADKTRLYELQYELEKLRAHKCPPPTVVDRVVTAPIDATKWVDRRLHESTSARILQARDQRIAELERQLSDACQPGLRITPPPGSANLLPHHQREVEENFAGALKVIACAKSMDDAGSEIGRVFNRVSMSMPNGTTVSICVVIPAQRR